MPCADNNSDSCAMNTAYAHNENNSHTSDVDHCSPFCGCNCCHVPTIVTFNLIIEKCVTISAFFVSLYKEAPIKDMIYKIWQPPKI